MPGSTAGETPTATGSIALQIKGILPRLVAFQIISYKLLELGGIGGKNDLSILRILIGDPVMPKSSRVLFQQLAEPFVIHDGHSHGRFHLKDAHQQVGRNRWGHYIIGALGIKKIQKKLVSEPE
jgi:hypothetical protein